MIIKDSLTLNFKRNCVVVFSCWRIEPFDLFVWCWLCKHDNNPNTWFADRDLVYSKWYTFSSKQTQWNLLIIIFSCLSGQSRVLVKQVLIYKSLLLSLKVEFFHQSWSHPLYNYCCPLLKSQLVKFCLQCVVFIRPPLCSHQEMCTQEPERKT